MIWNFFNAMMNEVEILVLIDNIEKIDELLKEYKYITVVKDYKELKEKLSVFDNIHSRIAIIDLKYLTDDTIHLYPCIKKDLMYKSISLVAYGENISVSLRKTLYGIDFKGIIDGTLQETKTVIHHVIRRSNLYASTFTNNFVRAMIEYKGIGKDVKKLTYLLDYLIYKYEISNKNALNIRLVLISLIIAFKDENILKVASILKTIFKSENIDKLYRNYAVPTTVEGKIIAILLKINNFKNPSNYFSAINMTNMEPSLVEEIQEVYEKKILNIASYQDINFFYEQLNLFVLEHYPDDNIALFDPFFVSVNNLITESLIRVYSLSASIQVYDDKTIEVRLQYKTNMNGIMKEDTQKHISEKNHTSIQFVDEFTMSIVFIKNIQEEATEKNIEVNKIVDISNINAQHYSDDAKISATKFLEDFMVDQALLDELKENEQDMNNLLFEEETLSQNLIEHAAIILERFAHILDQTIEFIDLSASLESLSAVFNNVSLDTLETSKKETIRFYIQGLINDLEKWKTYIFIEPNTPDIHYLDASLLENCSEIEKFILSENSSDDETEDDDDDLEFF
jgi:hypothetical protein